MVSYSSLLRENRNFRLFWMGQIVSQLGDWFSLVTVQALVLKYTGSSFWVAVLFVAGLLPGLLIAPLVGVLVDRLPRKSVMVVSDWVRAGLALGLLLLRGPETVWIAYVCLFLIACFTAAFEPARISTVPNITTSEQLVTANALSSVTWSVLLTTGALVGGLVSRFLGPQAAFLLNSLSFVASALLLTRLKMNAEAADPHRQSGLSAIIEGFRFAALRPNVRWLLSAKLGWGLAGGIHALIPLYGQKLFPLPNDRDGQLAISLLFAANGLGTALGPIIARRATGQDPTSQRRALPVAYVLGGFFLSLIAVAHSLGAVMGWLFLSRINGSIIWVFSTILLQRETEDRFRGRVFALEGALFTFGMMVSGTVTGTLVDRGAATPGAVVLVSGLLSAVAGLAWIVRLSKLPRETGPSAEQSP